MEYLSISVYYIVGFFFSHLIILFKDLVPNLP